jgi:hypothetical protein
MGVNTGALYIIFIMLVIFGFAYITSGPTPSQTPTLTGPEVVLVQGNSGAAKANLQLYNFEGVTVTPPVNGLCSKGGDNKHPEALIAYLPQQSQAVSSTDGLIHLWVSDTKPPYISPNEQVTVSTGDVKMHGNLEATAPDGYLWEPAIYIFPYTVENNGKAYFPSLVQGDYNNVTGVGVSYGSDVLPPDSLPLSSYTVEFTWKVSDIGLTDNDYQIEFVAHDGNQKLGVRCMQLRIYTPPESENPGNKLPL